MAEKVGVATLKALRLIRDNDIRSATEFARLMWPDSAGWKRSYNIGYGATHGKGMWLAGGSFLAKLRYAGLITVWHERFRWEYSLTAQGKALLEEAT